jgi:hypothetical protein
MGVQQLLGLARGNLRPGQRRLVKEIKAHGFSHFRFTG